MSHLESRLWSWRPLKTASPFEPKRTGQAMLSKLRRDLDPLDLEILERALESAVVALKEGDTFNDLDSDEALEASLRSELAARSNGVSDADTLRDVLLAALSDQ